MAHGKTLGLAKLKPTFRIQHGPRTNRAERREIIWKRRREKIKERYQKARGGPMKAVRAVPLKNTIATSFKWVFWRFGWTKQYSSAEIILRDYRWKRLTSRLYWRQWRVFK